MQLPVTSTTNIQTSPGSNYYDPLNNYGEVLQDMQGAQARRAVHRFESNRLRPYSTRRIRHMIPAYALAAGIQKRVDPPLFRHQIITSLTKNGLISPTLP